MSKRDYKLYIEDIIESIGKIKKYVNNMSFDKFSKDTKTQDAVIRNFEIIGEATRQLSKDVKDKYPEVEWKSMLDFRNVIIHEYFGVNLKIIWDIILSELPPLEEKLKNI